MEWTRYNVARLIFCVYLLVCFPICGYLSYLFLTNTTLSFDTRQDSLPAKSQKFIDEHFPHIAPMPLFVEVKSVSHGETILAHNETLSRFSTALKTLCYSNSKFAPYIFGIEGYFLSEGDVMKNQFLSENKKITIISVNYQHKKDILDKHFTDFLYDALEDNSELSLNTSHLQFRLSGFALLQQDTDKGTASDFVRVDMVSIPIASAVLAFCLGTFRSLLIPAFSFPMSMLMSFAMTAPFTLFMNVSSFSPNMMSAMASALNIDYALFLFSRFNEIVKIHELDNLEDDDLRFKIVKETTLLTAHNILVSGITIALANAGLSIFPLDMIRTIGIGCCFAVLATVFVSMTFTPLILYLFFGFFTRRTSYCYNCGVSIVNFFRRMIGAPIRENDREDEYLLSTNLVDTDVGKEERYKRKFEAQSSSIWFKIATFTTVHPWVVFITVIACGIPFFILFTHLEPTFNVFLQVPNNAEHLPAFKDIMHSFGAGKTSPYYVSIESGLANGVQDETVFTAMQELIYRMSHETGQPVHQFTSIALVPSPLNPLEMKNVTWSMANELLNVIKDEEYIALWKNSVSKDNQSTIFHLYTTFAPMGPDARPFLDNLVPYIKEYTDNAFTFIGISGGACEQWAAMDWVMELFKYQIILVASIIFIFIGVSFKSLMLPFRMLLTVFYTIGFTYGFAVLVFQYVWLDVLWTALEGVDGIFWVMPVQCFTIVCGLAVDYDVFLLSRVVEYRKKGYTGDASLCKAVYKTGRIISYAGVIMAIAFSSLVFSHSMMMNQGGILMGVAVLLDTFVVRTLFMPAIMSLAKGYAYWPYKFKVSTRTVEDMDEENEFENDMKY